jgi:hypothetical protein
VVSPVTFHFVTWNDEGIGEFCLWVLPSMWRAESGYQETEYDLKKQEILRYFLSSACSCCQNEKRGGYVESDGSGKTDESEDNLCDRCRSLSLSSPIPHFYCSEFMWFPRLLFPCVLDQQWLRSAESPKNYIYEMTYCDEECDLEGRGGKLLVALKRKGYGKNGRNGFGAIVLRCEELINDSYFEKTLPNTGKSAKSTAVKKKTSILWYQFGDISISRKDIYCCKWSLPLCLGSKVSAGILLRGKGHFELVDQQYASAFQSLYDYFVSECTNICQVGQFVRFWTTSHGELKAFVVYPPNPALNHPEWAELLSETYTPATLWSLRVIGRRLGYFISDIGKDVEPLNSMEIIYNSRRGRKSGPNHPPAPQYKLLKSGCCSVARATYFRRYFFSRHLVLTNCYL